jgi:hypothetical protein
VEEYLEGDSTIRSKRINKNKVKFM